MIKASILAGGQQRIRKDLLAEMQTVFLLQTESRKGDPLYRNRRCGTSNMRRQMQKVRLSNVLGIFGWLSILYALALFAGWVALRQSDAVHGEIAKLFLAIPLALIGLLVLVVSHKLRGRN